MSEGRALIRDYGASVVAAVIVAILIRIFVVEAYRIPSSAMRPTLEPGDTVFVWKWKYWSAKPPAPARGEVVVFSPATEPRRDYIKRVIGLPGDEVEMRDGKIALNGKSLATSLVQGACGAEHLPDGHDFPVCFEPPVIENFGPEKVPEGQVFVVGDLRSQSPGDTKNEGRRFKTWGLFPISTLKGRALWIWLSLEPQTAGLSGGWFPKFRFERMFKRVE